MRLVQEGRIRKAFGKVVCNGFFDCARQICRNESFKAFFQGRLSLYDIDCQIRLHNIANVKSARFMDEILDNDTHGISSTAKRAQLALRSHGQIANLAMEITPAEDIDAVWTAWALVANTALAVIRSVL